MSEEDKLFWLGVLGFSMLAGVFLFAVYCAWRASPTDAPRKSSSSYTYSSDDE